MSIGIRACWRIAAKPLERLRAMFGLFLAQPELMSENFRRRVDTTGLRRTVGDYLAGMTDRFAAREFERLFAGSGPGLATPTGGI